MAIYLSAVPADGASIPRKQLITLVGEVVLLRAFKAGDKSSAQLRHNNLCRSITCRHLQVWMHPIVVAGVDVVDLEVRVEGAEV